MRNFSLLLCLSISLVAGAQSLPLDARVVVDGKFRDGTVGSGDESFCADIKLTVHQVKQRLRAFHRITGQDLHDEYQFVPCGLKGKIILKDGQIFSWKSFVGDVLQTDYPDGTQHYMAGKPDTFEK